MNSLRLILALATLTLLPALRAEVGHLRIRVYALNHAVTPDPSDIGSAKQLLLQGWTVTDIDSDPRGVILHLYRDGSGTPALPSGILSPRTPPPNTTGANVPDGGSTVCLLGAALGLCFIAARVRS